MKIIGVGKNGKYIAEVSHSEVEKVFDKYYGNLKKLDAGDEVDLGAGYDYRSSIKSACKEMVDASRQFGSSQKSLMQFALMVSGLPDPEAEGAA